MLAPGFNTVLAIDILTLPNGSARGLSGTLEPINGAASMRRTVNGELINFGIAAFQKYKLSISGTDQVPPGFDGVWPGQTATVDCLNELAFTGSDPDRTPVEDSIRTDGPAKFYRPRLTMLVIDWQVQRDEWGAVTDWGLDLEEV